MPSSSGLFPAASVARGDLRRHLLRSLSHRSHCLRCPQAWTTAAERVSPCLYASKSLCLHVTVSSRLQVSVPPCRLVSASPCNQVSMSTCVQVSVSPCLHVSTPPCFCASVYLCLLAQGRSWQSPRGAVSGSARNSSRSRSEQTPKN